MKNKYIKNTLITVTIYIMLVLFLYFVMGDVIAKNSSDYLNQHTMFMDYIRRNFWISGDLFPQWNMNYGLGQSFVTSYYYGMYNPFVMLTYILPPINPVFIFETIFTILLGLNTLGMTKLLELNKIEGRLNTAVAVLSSFSGVFLFHMSTHPMFIYYLPIMTLSLVSLHYLVEYRIKSYYAITVALIFFTNFTFAPIISVLQFFYFTGLIVEKNKFNIRSYIQYLVSYIIGVISGMMVLLPTALFMVFTSSRTEGATANIGFLMPYKDMIKAIGSEQYASGIFIIGLMAMLGTLFITHKRKYLIVLVPMMLVIIFQPLNFAFNIFMYVHQKVYIMYLPLWWLMFAETIKKGNKLNLGILTIVSTLLFTIPIRNELTVSLSLVIILTSGIIYLITITEYRYITWVLCLILIAESIIFHIIVTPRSELSRFTNADGQMPAAITPYRELNKANNYLTNIYSQVPNIYSSLENDNYIQAVRLEYETPISSFVRQTKYDAFNNIYFQNLYAIKNNYVDVNPIVYGVTEDNVYSLDTYTQLNKDQKLYAVNQGIFTDQASDMSYQNQFRFEPVYSNDTAITVDSNQQQSIKIPKRYQDGVLNISFDSNLEHNTTQNQKISINGQTNEVMYQDRYGINDNSHITFRLATKDVDRLDIKVTTNKAKPIVYSNFKVNYQSLDDFEANKIKVVEPTSFIADMNDSYSFDLDMKKDGYLATTIPYDRGFKIYVDGERVKVEKLEDLFIGAKLSAGKHKIVIQYNIPGFKIGLILSSIGWLLIGYLFINERRSAPKL